MKAIRLTITQDGHEREPTEFLIWENRLGDAEILQRDLPGVDADRYALLTLANAKNLTLTIKVEAVDV